MRQLTFGGRSLTLRVLALLSLALLPLGSIAVWQSNRVAEQVAGERRLALLLITERAANPLQAVAQRGFGAARALGASLLLGNEDVGRCEARIERMLRQAQSYLFVLVTDAEGKVVCAAARDDAAGPLPEALELPRGASFPSILNAKTENVPEPVVIISEPVRDDGGTVVGAISLGVPKRSLAAPAGELPTEDPLALLTFNARGEVLTSSTPPDAIRAALPRDVSLAALSDGPAQVFAGPDGDGITRAFAVVPLVPGVAYAMTTWPQYALVATGLQRLLATSLLPIMMWLATLFVAFVALDRLIIRHIRGLSRQMRTFARTRRLIGKPVLAKAGADLARIETDFREMAHAILQDEARLENNLHEKNVLLKEVHHRVKNNLQLITSIMNMQMRKSSSEETRTTLRRLQERVLTLASVHRTLYRSSDMNRIDAGVLVCELANQLVAMSDRAATLRLECEAESIQLFPDQAVPLSMLCSEAVTNAARFAGVDATGVGRIRLELTRTSEEEGCLTVVSTLGSERTASPSQGLGAQLIRAFESQLSGSLDMGVEGDSYRVRIIFPIRSFEAETRDY
ncbi:sensor histidine kinase [Jannaschia ovalis]|uniref:histidine kinase n=1 Tax=Jannaschia ovalis TaxID=3038773 RepID=A0ABY8L8M3_9RHOB|nr:sensor histidine kinase [Jannaschia sp. GRR-S6-38]WGH77709.1 sensor histidine kinase [Jannaschia sp. GRR-S6-38]